MAEGKLLYEKAISVSDLEEALKIFASAISKSSSAQILHLNHIYHLRGLCQFKLKQYEKAERDFQ
jgi:isochorismate synthase EntC